MTFQYQGVRVVQRHPPDSWSLAGVFPLVVTMLTTGLTTNRTFGEDRPPPTTRAGFNPAPPIQRKGGMRDFLATTAWSSTVHSLGSVGIRGISVMVSEAYRNQR